MRREMRIEPVSTASTVFPASSGETVWEIHRAGRSDRERGMPGMVTPRAPPRENAPASRVYSPGHSSVQHSGERVDSLFPKFVFPAPDIVWRPEIEDGAGVYMLGAALHFVT